MDPLKIDTVKDIAFVARHDGQIAMVFGLGITAETLERARAEAEEKVKEARAHVLLTAEEIAALEDPEAYQREIARLQAGIEAGERRPGSDEQVATFLASCVPAFYAMGAREPMVVHALGTLLAAGADNLFCTVELNTETGACGAVLETVANRQTLVEKVTLWRALAEAPPRERLN